MADVKETLYKGDCSSILDGNLSTVIENLQALQLACPKEFVDSLRVDTEVFEDYGYGRCTVEVYYYRPETEEEAIANTKKAIYKANAERIRELKLLQALKAKYGDVTDG